MAKLEAKSISAGQGRTLPAGSATLLAPHVAANESTRQNAQKDLESKLKVAFEQSRSDGLAQGQAKAAADFQERLLVEQKALELARESVNAAETQRRQQFEGLIEALREKQHQLEHDAEILAVELAFRALVRLLHVRHEDRSLLAEACTVAMQELGSAAIRIRIPQAASALIRSHAQVGVEIVVDTSLQPDQCFVETLRGESETGLATRLEGLKQSLLNALQEGSANAA